MIITEAVNNPIVLNEEAYVQKRFDLLINTNEELKSVLDKIENGELNVDPTSEKEITEFVYKYGDSLEKLSKAIPEDSSKANNPKAIVMEVLRFAASDLPVGVVFLILGTSAAAPALAPIFLICTIIIRLIILALGLSKLFKNREDVKKAGELVNKINDNIKKINVNSIKNDRVKRNITNLKTHLDSTEKALAEKDKKENKK